MKLAGTCSFIHQLCSAGTSGWISCASRTSWRIEGWFSQTPSEMMSGARVPTPVKITDVLGIQRGTTRPNDVVIISGHIDSRVTDVMNATADAPGANDDASGVALVLEAARILSKERFDATIVYAVFSAEEQGLWGATLLAETVRARGWQVDAMLNNDIVGNSLGQGGVINDRYVRVFSEGIRASESLPEAIERLDPDLAVVDLSMPVQNGADVARQLMGRFPGLRLIALSVHDEPTVAARMRDAAVAGFVLKRTAAADLVPAVKAVLGGGSFVSPGVLVPS